MSGLEDRQTVFIYNDVVTNDSWTPVRPGQAHSSVIIYPDQLLNNNFRVVFTPSQFGGVTPCSNSLVTEVLPVTLISIVFLSRTYVDCWKLSEQ